MTWILSLLPALKYIGILGSVIVAVGGYFKGKSDAYKDAEIAAYKQYEERIKRVNKVNEEYRVEILELLRDNEILEEKVKKANEEARNDPHAKRPALSRDGVSRLNRIK